MTKECCQPSLPDSEFSNDPCADFLEEAKIMVYAAVQPGEVFTKEIAREIGLTSIVLVGNKNLRAKDFRFRGRDRHPIAGISYPGKSATIDYLTPYINDERLICKKHMDSLVLKCFGKPSDRRDGLYKASIEAIADIGYMAFFTPTSNTILHIRLVHERTFMRGEDPTAHDRQNLAGVFKRIYPQKNR